MISASSPHWRELMAKRQQLAALAAKQRRIVAAALGCDEAAAAAALASLAGGQPVRDHLEGFISVPPPEAAAAGGQQQLLPDGAAVALEDSAAAKALLADAAELLSELAFWYDGPALAAWLQLRAGRLEDAAAAADAAPNAYLLGLQQLAAGSERQQHWSWRWWLLAQVRWHQGDLSAARHLLQQGQQQLAAAAASAAHDGAGAVLWRRLLPCSAAEVATLAAALGRLTSLKDAGNSAVNAKRFDAAVEAYDGALALAPVSAAFAAMLHSNRAAAYQQQGRLLEALSDCSRAVALNPRYTRAYAR